MAGYGVYRIARLGFASTALSGTAELSAVWPFQHSTVCWRALNPANWPDQPQTQVG